MPSTGHWVAALQVDDRALDDAAILAAASLMSEVAQGKASAAPRDGALTFRESFD